MKPILSIPIVRDLCEGAAGLFDIFWTDGNAEELGTPEDDVRNMHRDLQKIGGDFALVLSRGEFADPGK